MQCHRLDGLDTAPLDVVSKASGATPTNIAKTVSSEGMQLTRCSFLEHCLQMGSQSNDMVRWSRPKYKAVSGICESRLCELWPLNAQEKRINDYLLEIRGKKFLLLLRISRHSVC